MLHGGSIVVATGSASRTLPGIEIGGRVITSDQALELDHVPERVVVLGGGVIGVEFASLLRSFGAEVTVIEALERIVAAEEPSISKHLTREFKKRGITSRTGTKVSSVEADETRACTTGEERGGSG